MKKIRECFKGTLVGAFAFYMACVLAIGTTGALVQGCTASQVEADIQKVIADIPTALDIAQSIITIVGAYKGGSSAALTSQVSAIAGQVSSDMKLASTLLTQYEANLSSAPVTVISELDSAVSDAQTNLGSILTACHVVDPATAESVGYAVAGVASVLLALESLLPASAAAQFPKVSANLRALGTAPGALHVKIESAHAVASTFNKKVKKFFPKAQVEVPSAHVWVFPVPFTHHKAA